MRPRFDRNEIAGSLGDLGTLLPLALGLILINGLDPTATFVGAGLFYVLAGLYFRVTVPVQPMKVICAYAIASGMSAGVVSASGFWVCLLLLLLVLSGTMNRVQTFVPRATVRGVQLATGVLLFVQGIRFILGKTGLQVAQGSAEPFLSVTSLGPIPLGIPLGVITVAVILGLTKNRVVPAVLVVIAAGAAAGLSLGGWRNLAGFHVGLHLPHLFPFGLPTTSDLAIALTALALPQIPMTIGNAVVAQADLTREYFGETAARRSTPRALAVSMGLANLATGLFGGMPLCHGAGGLAAHYRFGARTAGSNLIIGALLLAVGILVGDRADAVFGLLPFSVLGALLCFAGAELAMMILDVRERKDLFVVVAMLAVSLVSGVGAAFLVGILLAHLLEHSGMSV